MKFILYYKRSDGYENILACFSNQELQSNIEYVISLDSESTIKIFQP